MLMLASSTLDSATSRSPSTTSLWQNSCSFCNKNHTACPYFIDFQWACCFWASRAVLLASFKSSFRELTFRWSWVIFCTNTSPWQLASYQTEDSYQVLRLKLLLCIAIVLHCLVTWYGKSSDFFLSSSKLLLCRLDQTKLINSQRCRTECNSLHNQID